MDFNRSQSQQQFARDVASPSTSTTAVPSAALSQSSTLLAPSPAPSATTLPIQQPLSSQQPPPVVLELNSSESATDFSSAHFMTATTNAPCHRLSIDTALRKSVGPSGTTNLLNTNSMQTKNWKSAAPAGTSSVSSQVITNKPRSISYFIDLIHIDNDTVTSPRLASPTLNNYAQDVPVPFHSQLRSSSPHQNQLSLPSSQPRAHSPLSKSRNPATLQTSKFKQQLHSPSSPWSTPQHTWARYSPTQLANKMQQKQCEASLRRSEIMDKKREKLRLRSDQIRYRVLIQRQRDRLLAHKIRARTEIAISAATLKRQLLLKKNVERFGAAVEHAQTVAMVQRLKKVTELRKAYSDTFLFDIKEFAGSHANTQLFSLLGKAGSGSFLNILGDLENSWLEGVTDLSNAPQLPVTAKTFSLSSIAEQTEPEDLQSNVPYSISQPSAVSESTSNPSSGVTAVILDTFEDPAPLESVAQSIRRTQSLPNVCLDELDELEYSEFLDLLPPVTRYTLRELDLDEILNNPQLRHDLYFDPNLQFKPNLDGERGEQKQTKQELYWMETGEEFALEKFYRVPLLLFEIRAIMLELLPPTGTHVYNDDGTPVSGSGRIRWWREEIERNLDVNFIAQQVEHGVLNVIGVVDYIAELLKANCAPARDEVVDAMVLHCREGRVAQTFKTCFELLELMKLDYANHQLHRLRPYVVEHAIDFEWRWFKDQLENGSLKLDDTALWLREAFQRHHTKHKLAGKTTKVEFPNFPDLYHEALINLIEQSAHFSDTVAVPETLRMDTSRLVNFYNDWQDITIMASLLIIFKQACAPPKSISSTTSSKRLDPVSIEKHCQEAKKTLWILLNDSETSLNHITLQISSMAGRARGAALDEREKSLLSSLVDKTLSPDSKIYELVAKRVASVLLDYFARTHAELKKQSSTGNFSEMQEEYSDSSDSDADEPELDNSIAARIRRKIEERNKAKLKQIEEAQTVANATTHESNSSTTVTLDQALLSKYGLSNLETELQDLCDRITKLSDHNRAVYAPVYVSLYSSLREEF